MRFAALMLVLLCLPAGAIAGEPYVPIAKRLRPDELATLGLTNAQLERLDALLAAAQSREPSPSTSAPQPSAPWARNLIGLDPDPASLVAHVKGPLAGWSPSTVFQLDNGQQWAVLKGTVRLARPLQAPAVRLVPGIAGRWFLALDEDHPKARVYRVD